MKALTKSLEMALSVVSTKQEGGSTVHNLGRWLIDNAADVAEQVASSADEDGGDGAAEGGLRAEEVPPSIPPGDDVTLPPEILAALTKLDDELVGALQRGDVGLLRSEWLLAQPEDFRLCNRQDLETLEAAGASPSPLLTPDEAVALVRKGSRSAGVVSHGWLSNGHPDPAGERVRVLRRALQELPHIEAVFFDFPSLFQWPRDAKQNEAFANALKVVCSVAPHLYLPTAVPTLQLTPAVPRAARPSGADGQPLRQRGRHDRAADQGDSSATGRVRRPPLPLRSQGDERGGRARGSATIWLDRQHRTRQDRRGAGRCAL
jgi:hypothetical protein